MIAYVATTLLAPLAMLWVFPVLSDLTSAVKALLSPSPAPGGDVMARPRLLIAVPAHDEAGFIQTCVQSLMEMRRDRADWDVVVVADNCSDRTAQLAGEAGADVCERTAPERPGKPAAIEWLLGQVELSLYDAMVIVDADSTVDPGFADAYAGVPRLRHCAAQGYNDISNPGDSWLSLLGRLLIRIRYDGQYPLKRRASINCPLTGNGMCVGMEVLDRLGWSSKALTENWDMYARYTAAGVRVTYVPGAHIYSHEAVRLQDSAIRRHRWQAGRWHVLRQHIVRILGSRRIGLHQKLDVLSEIASPGPVVYGTVAVVMVGLLAILPLPGRLGLMLLFGSAAVYMGLWTVGTWIRQPNRAVLAGAFVRLPFYAAWRLALAARSIMTGRGRRWERSPRDSPDTIREIEE